MWRGGQASALAAACESGIIFPVPEAESLVGPWRARYEPTAAAGMPAHITLLYPFLAPELVTAADLERLAALFAAVPCSRFELTAPGRFPGVLYLAPEPAAFMRELTYAIWELYPQAPPYGGQFAEVVPHLTVAQVDDPAVLDEVEAAVAPGLPISARASEAWLIVLGDDSRWRLRHRFALGRP